MAHLQAQGAQPDQRWRRPLPSDSQQFVLGRAAGPWSVPWDQHISRQHAQLVWQHGKLEVEMLPAANNPIFKSGQEVRHCVIVPGEHFVLGETVFTVLDEPEVVEDNSPSAVNEQTFSAHYLRGLRFYNADQRIEVLARLPELISGALSEEEFLPRLAMMLMAGIPRASMVALVQWQHHDGDDRVHVLHWERRLGFSGDFRPSHKLVTAAVGHGHSVLHIWNAAPHAGDATYTMSDNVDWAFCTPMESEACPGWAVYVGGRNEVERTPLTPALGGSGTGSVGPIDLRGDLKFTELVASTFSALQQVQLLQRRQATLSQFFAPAVFQAFGSARPDVVLQPRETEVTVLFCDLRGFSLHSERMAGNLMALLERVSDALGVMTHEILDHGGVLGDFQGDAAMGFWGWPLAQADKVPRACRAALAINDVFQKAAHQADQSLADFRVGIGMATGRAVAGRIGTEDQVKVTVFGPVVNLASRLEGMTKLCRAPILLDGPTAEIVRQQLPAGAARLRRVATIRPYGMYARVEVSELLPPAGTADVPGDDDLQSYAAALSAFEQGQWSAALEQLEPLAARDGVAAFLRSTILGMGGAPAPGFDGVISLETK
ncbi:MAG: adenylate/guanylate cyclase domain-containing protein [Planctomycetes bacterium]|nr:adenylate/guanylate cyclase domain-containing protein [Planctomycetota bacterium]